MIPNMSISHQEDAKNETFSRIGLKRGLKLKGQMNSPTTKREISYIIN